MKGRCAQLLFQLLQGLLQYKHPSQMTARGHGLVCLLLPLLQLQNKGAIDSSTHQPLWQRDPCKLRVRSQGVMVVEGAQEPTVEVLDCV